MRTVVRIVATLAAVWSAVAGFAGPGGAWGALLGTLVGVVVGQWLGRSRWRWQWLVAIPLLVLFLGRFLSELLVGLSQFGAWFGPTAVLALSAGVWFLALAGASILGLRSLAVRYPQLVALELAAITGGLCVSFAPHRDGAVGRPLWLSDWAWSQGWAPTTVLLAIGTLAAIVLLLLWALEARPGGRAGVLWVPLLPLSLFWLIDFNPGTDPAEARALRDVQEGYGEKGDPDTPHPGARRSDPPPEAQAQRGSGGTRERPGAGESSETPRDQEIPESRSKKKRDQATRSGAEKNRERRAANGESPGRDPTEQQGGRRDPKGSADKKQKPAGKELPFDREGAGHEEADPIQGGEGREKKAQDESSTSDRDAGSASEAVDLADMKEGDSEAPPPPALPVAVVLLEDDFSPPLEYFYFRQEPHSQYNGRRMVPAAGERDRDYLREFASQETALAWAPPVGHRVEVAAKVALLAEHTAPFALEAPVTFAPERNPYPQRFVATYRFTSLSIADFNDLLRLPVGDADWDNQTWQHYTSAPSDPRYRALAERLIAGLRPELANLPVAKAVALKLHLDATVTYSTKKRLSQSPDPTADFLFGDRIGYCVHNAHAMTYLLRVVGLPARIGTGYAVPETHERGGAILISSSHAHAWPELFVRGVGWVPIDIAPKKVLDHRNHPLDEETLKQLAQMARRPPEAEARMAKSGGLWTAIKPYLWRVGLSILVATLLCLFAVKLWRRTWRFWATQQGLPRVAYRDGLDRLAEVGLVRRFGETREGFAQRVRWACPTFLRATALHGAGTLGWPLVETKKESRPEFSRATWRTLVVRLRHELSASTPRWRRWLGAANPVSFVWTR